MSESVKLTTLKIAPAEFQARTQALLSYVQKHDLAGVVLFDRDYVLYFTGFAFIPTERPLAFVMNRQGKRVLFVPRLELEHAQSRAAVDTVEYYAEYPSTPHPIQVLKGVLAKLNITQSVGADHDGYPWIFGYRGPSLSELGYKVMRVTSFIEDMMMVKSPAELALLRESAKWGNLAHRLLQQYTRVGASETEVSLRASHEATLAMLETLGPLYAAQSMENYGASAGYRGQIGRNAAIPHALANNTRFQPGDVLVTGAGAPVWGYHSELERTMIVGKPSDEQRRFFDHMVALQDLALRQIRPGVKCSDVDRAVRAYYEAHDLTPYWKHHVGHAIGLRYHEAPFLDIGDDTEIRAGMVFTVEPGLYAPNLGGFRHSDTVIVHEDGCEVITYYPRDLESLIIPA